MHGKVNFQRCGVGKVNRVKTTIQQSNVFPLGQKHYVVSPRVGMVLAEGPGHPHLDRLDDVTVDRQADRARSGHRSSNAGLRRFY